jgi:hypothetical protein
VSGLSALTRKKVARVEMKRAVFILLAMIATAPALARTPDNSVINFSWQYPSAGGTPESNFMSNAYQRHGPGMTDDNYMQDTTMREDSDNYLGDQNDRWRRRIIYQYENDQDDP